MTDGTYGRVRGRRNSPTHSAMPSGPPVDAERPSTDSATGQQATQPERLSSMLTSREVARMLCVAPSTLCRWRATGKGPRVYWLGAASPRYREDDILEWLERMAA